MAAQDVRRRSRTALKACRLLADSFWMVAYCWVHFAFTSSRVMCPRPWDSFANAWDSPPSSPSLLQAAVNSPNPSWASLLASISHHPATGSTYREVNICRNASAWSGGRGLAVASATAARTPTPAVLISLLASSDVHSARDFCRSVCRSWALWTALSATPCASFLRVGSISVSTTCPLPWEMLEKSVLILPSKPSILHSPTNSPQHNTPSSFLSAFSHVSTTSSARSRNSLFNTSASRATTS
mmetsp:Transcript_12125/g.26857  ORF Transcript_12125/g.26857 Transcript_12125/m.26857 type:complete len:242 (-) Transcript_12125:2-727(-)